MGADIHYEWDLSSIYKGLDDPEFEKDMETICFKHEETVKSLNSILLKKENPVSDLKQMVQVIYDWEAAYAKLDIYLLLCGMIQSENREIKGKQIRLWEMMDINYIDDLHEKLDDYLRMIPELEEILKSDGLLWANRNYLRRRKKELGLVVDSEMEEEWMELHRKMSVTSINDIIDDRCFLWKNEMVSAEDLSTWYYTDMDKDEVKTFLSDIYQKAADYLVQYKRTQNLYAKMYGFQNMLEVVLEESYMKPETFADFMTVLEDKKGFYEDYEKSLKRYREWVSDNYVSGQKKKTRKDLTKKEEAEKTIEEVCKCFQTICPDFTVFIRDIAEKGWIDFYYRPGKQKDTSDGECISISAVRESRISIQGLEGVMLSYMDYVAHESAHAFSIHLQKEPRLYTGNPYFLEEVFSLYTEIVVERYINKMNKDRYQWMSLAFDREDYISYRLPEEIFSDISMITFEKRLNEMLERQEKISYEDICGIYAEFCSQKESFRWVFNRQLFKDEFFSIKYLLSQILALALDHKIRSQGNVFQSEDIKLWGEMSELSVEEFVERLTGKPCTKEVWTQMMEQCLFEPMKRIMQEIEILISGKRI